MLMSNLHKDQQAEAVKVTFTNVRQLHVNDNSLGLCGDKNKRTNNEPINISTFLFFWLFQSHFLLFWTILINVRPFCRIEIP